MEGRLVLVIEDNEMNMKLIRSLLRVNKCKILEANNAEEGIELAKKNRPDLILMDIQLPGMDGYTATGIIKHDEALKEIPVVAITAHAMAGDEKKALDSGCDGYITKPIDTRAFPKLLDTLLIDRKGIRNPARETRKKNRILILEGDPVHARLLSSKLSSENYVTRVASSSKEGLQMIASELPDLILLDSMMPDIDGFAVTKMLKRDQMTMDTPVILMMQNESMEDKIRGLEAGADELLDKSVDPSELLVRIESLINLKQYKEQLINHRRAQDLFLTPLPPRESAKELAELPTVLLVEDNQTDVKIVQNYSNGMSAQMEVVGSAEEALSMVSRRSVDVILLDILLPGIDGFTLCRRLKEEFNKNIQILIVTCLKDLKDKIKGIEHGADDFLIKPILKEEFRARLSAAFRRKAYLDRLNSRLAPELYATITDHLTGLYNHAYFKCYMGVELKRSNQHSDPLSLITMDIDNFKDLNDKYGEWVGDEILKEVGRMIRRNIRATDLTARCGGDEFTVLLPYTNCDEAEKVADRVRKSIAESPLLIGKLLLLHNPTLSLGIAESSSSNNTVESMINEASRALDRAKQGGKNRIHILEGRLKDEFSTGRPHQERS